MASMQARTLNAALGWLVRRRFDGNVDFRTVRKAAAVLDRWIVRDNAARFDRTVAIGGVRCDWFEPATASSDRVLLYLHGGGFIAHLPATYRMFARRLAEVTGARVLLPEYRLAPEHPFPAASDDCLATFRGLLESGVRPARVVIAGDSAGASLALVTVLRIRDAGLRMPACAVLLSGAYDLTWRSASLDYNAQTDPLVAPEALPQLLAHYVDPANASQPWVSPLNADFAGLPPLQFQAGSREVLLDDSIRAVEKARWAGVDVDLKIWAGMPHVFQMVDWLPESAKSLARIADFVTRHVPASRAIQVWPSSMSSTEAIAGGTT